MSTHCIITLIKVLINAPIYCQAFIPPLFFSKGADIEDQTMNVVDAGYSQGRGK